MLQAAHVPGVAPLSLGALEQVAFREGRGRRVRAAGPGFSRLSGRGARDGQAPGRGVPAGAGVGLTG